MAGQQETGELTAKVAGQELSVRGVSINTIATVVTLAAVSVILYMGYTHGQDMRESQGAVVKAMQLIADAQQQANQIHRETNCLIGYQGPAENKAAFCKTVTR